MQNGTAEEEESMDYDPVLVEKELTDLTECGRYFLYFAFGSNLLTERIHLMNPSAQYVASVRLDNYKLGFADFSHRWMGAGATIGPCPGEVVYGVLWRVDIADSDHLDEQERRYHRCVVTVTCAHTGRTYTCRSYQMNDLISGDHLPSPHYMHTIISGAMEHRLPYHYIQKLITMPDNGYEGPVEMRLSVLKELNGE